MEIKIFRVGCTRFYCQMENLNDLVNEHLVVVQRIQVLLLPISINCVCFDVKTWVAFILDVYLLEKKMVFEYRINSNQNIDGQFTSSQVGFAEFNNTADNRANIGGTIIGAPIVGQ